MLLLAEWPPSVQATVAVEVPGLVVEPTFQVHDTRPEESATGFGFSPAAVDMFPEWYFTLTLQVAPGEVVASRVASAPWLTDAGRLVICTVSVVGLGLAGVGVGPGVDVAAGVGEEAASAMP